MSPRIAVCLACACAVTAPLQAAVASDQNASSHAALERLVADIKAASRKDHPEPRHLSVSFGQPSPSPESGETVTWIQKVVEQEDALSVSKHLAKFSRTDSGWAAELGATLGTDAGIRRISLRIPTIFEFAGFRYEGGGTTLEAGKGVLAVLHWGSDQRELLVSAGKITWSLSSAGFHQAPSTDRLVRTVISDPALIRVLESEPRFARIVCSAAECARLLAENFSELRPATATIGPARLALTENLARRDQLRRKQHLAEYGLSPLASFGYSIEAQERLEYSAPPWLAYEIGNRDAGVCVLVDRNTQRVTVAQRFGAEQCGESAALVSLPLNSSAANSIETAETEPARSPHSLELLRLSATIDLLRGVYRTKAGFAGTFSDARRTRRYVGVSPTCCGTEAHSLQPHSAKITDLAVDDLSGSMAVTLAPDRAVLILDGSASRDEIEISLRSSLEFVGTPRLLNGGSRWLPLTSQLRWRESQDIELITKAENTVLGSWVRASQAPGLLEQASRWRSHGPVVSLSLLSAPVESLSEHTCTGSSAGPRQRIRVVSVGLDPRLTPTPRRLRDLSELACRAIGFLETEFGQKSPTRDFSLVLGAASGVEPDGTPCEPTPGVAAIALVATFSPLEQFAEEAQVATELARQWWGGLVFSDQAETRWLNSAVPALLGDLFVEALRGREAWLARVRFRASELTSFPPAIALTGFGRAVKVASGSPPQTRIHQSMGPLVLHMLRERVGPDRFRRFLRQLIADRRMSEVTLADLRASAAALLDLDLGELFEDWVRSPGIPRITLSYSIDETEDGGAIVTGQLHQEILVGKDLPLDPSDYFRFRSTLRFVLPDDRHVDAVLNVDRQDFPFALKLPQAPNQVFLSPTHDVPAGISVRRVTDR